jgi:plastocyanin domain-containing protein
MKNIILLVAVALGFSTAFAGQKPASQEIKMEVTEKGFVPSTIDVKPGTRVILSVTRITDATCATAIQIPAKKVKMDLPLNKNVKIDIGKLEKGEIRFACGMDMITGQIIVR